MTGGMENNEYQVKILMTEFVTHDVKRFIVEKPEGFKFIPGQATKLTIKKLGFENKKNNFTFTSLNSDLVLEFTIKSYPEREGVTEKLHELESGDEVVIRNPFGTINFKGSGIFIAGGAGITPFIAIFRQLRKENKIDDNWLFVSNKTSKDIILEKEFREMLGDNLVLTLTREEKEGYEYGRIDFKFLKRYIKKFKQNFYLCGSEQFVEDIKNNLDKLGVETQSIIIEE